MIKKIFKNYGHYIYLYIFSCFTLLLCSLFSPIYHFNFAADPSIYLTIGRGILNGLVPYKDLLDIKGPIIFFLYAIFSPIRLGKNFFGIFILETFCLWICITFTYKTIYLLSKSKSWAFILTLIYPFVFLNNNSFGAGGEAEEFILPFVSVFIFITIKIIKNNYNITKVQCLIQGTLLGCVFWIKYTTIGAWIAFYLCIIIMFIIKKNFKQLINLLIFNFLGFLIPTTFILFYFIYNHALSDLLWGYFGWNFVYGSSTHAGILKQLLFMVFHSFSSFFKRNTIIWFLVILGPYLATLSSKLFSKISAKIMLILMIFFNLCLEFSAGNLFEYYQSMAIPFISLTFSWIAIKLKNIKFSQLILIPLISILTLVGILMENHSINESIIKNYEPYQIKFAKLITKHEQKPTILDFNELDTGWYNYLDVFPTTKHFNKMNIHYSNGIYKPYIQAQLNIVKKQKVEYLICSISEKNKRNSKLNKIVFKNYQIIAEHKINTEKDHRTVLLLERK